MPLEGAVQLCYGLITVAHPPFLVLLFYRRFSGKTNVPIAVLSEYAEKEYEPFDSYSRFCPAMPVSVCFFDTALCTPGKKHGGFFALSSGHGLKPNRAPILFIIYKSTVCVHNGIIFIISLRRRFSADKSTLCFSKRFFSRDYIRHIFIRHTF